MLVKVKYRTEQKFVKISDNEVKLVELFNGGNLVILHEVIR